MSAAKEIAARVAACRAKAQSLMADLDGLIGELPEWREEAEGIEAALMEVRAELEMAVGEVDGAIDYLTPRSDDDDPGCCAHRRLQVLITTEEARS
jgi:hypothetical protein